MYTEYDSICGLTDDALISFGFEKSSIKDLLRFCKRKKSETKKSK